MRERAEVIGGALAIASTPGDGTRVTIKFPLLGGEEGNGNDNARSGG
jgi:nitrate/nitrite-specific signal transduction histidine kinase